VKRKRKRPTLLGRIRGLCNPEVTREKCGQGKGPCCWTDGRGRFWEVNVDPLTGIAWTMCMDL